MKPNYQILRQGYPLRSELQKEALYESLGWSDLIKHPGYADTCAIRMSVALAGAGIAIPGSLTIKSGVLKGKVVEPGQRRLSNVLKRMWGQPEVFKSEDAARTGIGNKSGVVSFFRIDGTAQGHIDLVEPVGNGFHKCAMACYFQASEIWFWPL